jgi:uncharacterized membrane protein (UPF0127 family)
MRIAAAITVLALIGASCTGSVDDAPSTSTSAAISTTSTAAAVGVPPELSDYEVRDVSVGDRILTLAIADSPALRAKGLMHVTDLGSLDGMLFYWRHEALGGFWMKDTVIPLDIVWFDVEGQFVGRASMEPCDTDDCPTYEPDADVDFRYGIEANPGDLDWVNEDTVIVYSG